MMMMTRTRSTFVALFGEGVRTGIDQEGEGKCYTVAGADDAAVGAAGAGEGADDGDIAAEGNDAGAGADDVSMAAVPFYRLLPMYEARHILFQIYRSPSSSIDIRQLQM